MTDAEFQNLRNEVMANRMVLRAIVAVTARLANPQDPREFVSSVEEAISAQLDLAGDLYPGATEDARARVKTGVRDILGRMDWG